MNFQIKKNKKYEDWKKSNKTIVFTNGCFDLLHKGHTDLLTKASKYGDKLIVGINSDESVKKIKGKKRPIENQIIRKKNLLPPFARLIAIIVSASKHSLSIEGAREIKRHLNKIDDIEILGPVDSPLLKIKKKFRTRLLIRFNGKSLIQKKLANLLNSLKISSKIKLTVDVDPVNFG